MPKLLLRVPAVAVFLGVGHLLAIASAGENARPFGSAAPVELSDICSCKYEDSISFEVSALSYPWNDRFA